jgi:hypothetical protein
MNDPIYIPLSKHRRLCIKQSDVRGRLYIQIEELDQDEGRWKQTGDYFRDYSLLLNENELQPFIAAISRLEKLLLLK